MSKRDSSSTFKKSDESRNQPVVCITPSPKLPPENLIRAIIRAQTSGHRVIVAPSKAATDTVVTYARRLGAAVITFEQGRTNCPSLRSKAAREARDAGFPGVILHQNPAKRVDFEASRETLQENGEYVLEAIYESAIDTEPTVLVGVPAYNEAEQIDSVVIKAFAYADEVLVVDDGSSDATRQVAADAGATVVRHNNNMGYGQALRTVFSEAARSDADHLVILDGDGQHNPEDIPRLVEAQRENEADIVIGNRFGDDAETNMPFYRRFGLSIVNLVTNISMGTLRPADRIADTQSGFRAYNQSAIESLADAECLNDGMGASTDILHFSQSNGLEITEIGTTIEYDAGASSSHNSLSHGLTLISNLLQTIEEERPILSIGVPGFLSTLLGLGIAYWAISNYISTGVFSIGLAVASVFFALAGIFACFTAIILHSLNQHK